MCCFAYCFLSERIELIRPIDLSVAKRVCTDDDLLYVFGHKPTEADFVYTEDEEILKRFFEVWTRKEALIKLGNDKCSLEKHYYHKNEFQYVISIATYMV